jgi:hypothetical protein
MKLIKEIQVDKELKSGKVDRGDKGRKVDKWRVTEKASSEWRVASREYKE